MKISIKQIISVCILTTVIVLGAGIKLNHQTPFEAKFPAGGLKVKGDFVATGNSVLCVKNADNTCNNNYTGYLYESDTMYKKEDAGASWSLFPPILPRTPMVLNSSKATLTIPAGIKQGSEKVPGRIKWAGLYWQGHIADKNPALYNNLTKDRDKVKIVMPDGDAHDIVADKVWYHDFARENTCTDTIQSNCGFRSFYQGYKDITTLVQDGIIDDAISQEFTVGDIQSTQGLDWFGSMDISETSKNEGFKVGFWGNWTIVIVYEAPAEITMPLKSVNIFHGFDLLMPLPSNTDMSIEVPINGFKTPKSGTIDAKMMFYASGGEKLIDRDNLYAQDAKNGNIYREIVNSANPANNPFNGTISNNGVPVNNSIGYYPGMDLDTFNISDFMKNDQTSTKFKLGAKFNNNNGDQSTPGMVAFSAELAVPELCYDYSVTNQDGTQITRESPTTTERQYKVNGVTKLKTKVFLRSTNGDFDLSDARMKVSWSDIDPIATSNPSSRATFDYDATDGVSQVQPPLQYGYENAVAIDGEAETISIGRNNSDHGGLIERLQSVYAKVEHSVSNTNHLVQMDISGSVSIPIDPNNASNLVTIPYSTQSGLKKCEGTQAYNPRWLDFNIERPNATDVAGVTNKYSIYTQIAGKPFSVQVVSYGTDTQTVTPVTKNIGMGVEMFALPSFKSIDDRPTPGSSTPTEPVTYDRVCEDSDGIPWASGKPNFAMFTPNQDRANISLSDLDNKKAFQNLAFRAWILETKENLTDTTKIIKENSCTNTDSGCFKTLYANDTYYTTTADNATKTACTSGTDLECYNELRKNYSRPVCSRDNFSVRPNGVYLEPRDNHNNSKLTDNSSTGTPITIAADDGAYTIYAHGTLWNKPIATGVAHGYGYDKLKTGIKDTVLGSGDSTNNGTKIEVNDGANRKSISFFGLVFKDDTGSGCLDEASQSVAEKVVASNSVPAESNALLPNVGNYSLVFVDNDWTIVDQARHEHKTVLNKANRAEKLNDCNTNNAEPTNTSGNGIVEMYGCTTSSVTNELSTKLIPVKVIPHHFDLSAVTLDSSPTASKRWGYMSNLENLSEEERNKAPALKYKGALTAVNASGAIASNFTNECAASPVELYFDYADANNAPTDKNMSWKSVGAVVNNLGLMASTRYRNGIINADSGTAISNDLNSSQTSAPIIIPSSAFLKPDTVADTEVPGRVDIDIAMNINRLSNAVAEPINIIFKNLKAKVSGLLATYNGTTDFITEGEKREATELINSIDVIGKSHAFIYGTVYSQYMGATQSIKGLSVDTFLSAVGYCTTDCDKYSQDPYKIFEPSAVGATAAKAPLSAGWYRMFTHDKDNHGLISGITTNDASAKIDGLASKGETKFILNGSTDEATKIKLEFPATGRDRLVTYTIATNPWLQYNGITNLTSPAGNPTFAINWIDPKYVWSGKGTNTGSTVSSKPNENSRRLSW